MTAFRISSVHRTVVFWTCLLLVAGSVSCSKAALPGMLQEDKRPAAGAFNGDAVSFEVSADRQMITDMRLTMGATGGMTAMHLPNPEIKIENNYFRFDRARDWPVPEVHLMGHFTSSKEASGWLNGVQWTARWVGKDAKGGK